MIFSLNESFDDFETEPSADREGLRLQSFDILAGNNGSLPALVHPGTRSLVRPSAGSFKRKDGFVVDSFQCPQRDRSLVL
jgi:hypothetical protein